MLEQINNNNSGFKVTFVYYGLDTHPSAMKIAKDLGKQVFGDFIVEVLLDNKKEVALNMLNGLLRCGTTRLVLLDERLYKICESGVGDTVPIAGLFLKYTNDAQLEKDLRKMWHIGSPNICQSPTQVSEYNNLADEVIELKEEREQSKTALKGYDRLQKDYDQLKIENETLRKLADQYKQSSIYADEYQTLDKNYKNLTFEYNKLTGQFKDNNAQLRRVMDRVNELQQQLKEEYQKGLDAGKELANKDKNTANIFNAMYEYKETTPLRLSTLVYNGSYKHIHLCFAGTDKTLLHVYNAILEDIVDFHNEQEAPTDVLFIDLSNECYAQSLLSVEHDRRCDIGSNWFRKPTFKTISKYIQRSLTHTWLYLMTPNRGNIYNTSLLLQVYWQKVFAELEMSGREVYIYFGKLDSNEKIILYNSLSKIVESETRLYYYYTNSIEVRYMKNLVTTLRNPDKLVVNVISKNGPVSKFLTPLIDICAQRNIQVQNVEYEFWKKIKSRGG